MGMLKKLLTTMLMFVFISTMTFAINSTVNVKVDMTILWGEELPDVVYLFPLQGGFTGVNSSGNTVSLGGYNNSLFNKETEQNLNGALALYDVNKDGIYEGTMKYTGNAQDIQYRLYVSGKDPKNYMKYPKYEKGNGTNVEMGDWNRKFYISEGVKYLNTSWENKDAKEIEFGNNNAVEITLFKGTTVDLEVKSFYNNNNASHFQWITKYVLESDITVVSGGEKIIRKGLTITAKDDAVTGNVVLKVKKQRLYGDNKQTNIEKTITIKIVDPTFAKSEQVIAMYPSLESYKILPKTTTTELYNLYGDFKVSGTSTAGKAFNMNNFTFATGNDGKYAVTESEPFTIKTNETGANGKQQYTYSFTGNSKNIAMFPIEFNKNATQLRDGNMMLLSYKRDSAGDLLLDSDGNPISEFLAQTSFRLPVPFTDLKQELKTGGVNITWNELPSVSSEHSNAYPGGQKIMVRLINLKDKDDNLINSENVKHDIYNQKNPIKNASINTNFDNFINKNSNGYIDFVFNHQFAGSEQSVISGGKIELRHSAGKIFIKGLDSGIYRAQVYTYKYSAPENKNTGYMVATLEGDMVFTAPDPNVQSDDNGKLYYAVVDTTAISFPEEIRVEVMTRSPKALYLTSQAIEHGLLDKTNQNSPVVGLVRHKSIKQVGEKNIDLGNIQLEQPIYTVSSTDSAIDYPLDIVVVYEQTSGMGDYKDNISKAMEKLNDYILNNTNYNPMYKLLNVNINNVDESNAKEWKSSFSDVDYHSFNDGNGSSDSAWGIYNAANILVTTGRKTATGMESKKWIIMISNKMAKQEDKAHGPDQIAQFIRDNDILLTGITNAFKKGYLATDDLGDTASSTYYVDDHAEQYYGHLKFIAGNKFKLYQIQNNENKIYSQLEDWFGWVGVIQKWIVSYPSPFQLKDGTLRQALFDIEMNYKEITGVSGVTKLDEISKDTDRQYRAPDESMKRTEYPNQVIIFNNTAGVTYLNGSYTMDDVTLPPGSRGYRRMKTIGNPIIDSAIEDHNYADIRDFSFNRDTFHWEYGMQTTTNGFMIEKVAENGTGTFQYTPTGSTTDLFNFAYRGNLRNFEINKNEDDKVSLMWEDSAINKYRRVVNTEKIFFRIVKDDNNDAVVTKPYNLYDTAPVETHSVQLLNYHYNLYDKQNPMRLLKYDETKPNGGDHEDDSLAIHRENLIGQFIENNIPYFDIEFTYDTNIELYAGGVAFTYRKNQLQISGLPKGKYALEAFTISRENDTYKIVTYEGAHKFEMDFNPAVTKYSSENNFFLIEYIDPSDFTKANTSGELEATVKVNFLTKASKELNLSPGAMYIEADTVYPMNPLKASDQGIMSEIKVTSPQNRKKVDATLTGGEISILPSKAAGFKYPLDIVLCIDNSGSMDDEIAAVRNSLKSFTQKLYENGYDVKYNVIAFGAEQTQAIIGSKWYNASGNAKLDYHSRWGENGNKKPTLVPYAFQYKPKWFDGSNFSGMTANKLKNATEEELLEYEVSEIQEALGDLKAVGGFIGGQENSLYAMWKAKELLIANGRGVDFKSKITENKSNMVMPSIKWVIMLSDENIYTKDKGDLVDFIHNEYKSIPYDKRLEQLANEYKGNDPFNEVRLTVLAHIGMVDVMGHNYYNSSSRDVIKIKEGKSNPIGWNRVTAMIDKYYYINDKQYYSQWKYPTTLYPIEDDRGVMGLTPSDNMGAFYAELRLYMGNLLGLYEMGLEGKECNAALMHAAENLGVIQRWVLQYRSPFNMADGSKREVDFIFKNNLVGKDGSKLTTFDGKPVTLKDFNHANIKTPEKGVIREKRTYIAPNDILTTKS